MPEYVLISPSVATNGSWNFVGVGRITAKDDKDAVAQIQKPRAIKPVWYCVGSLIVRRPDGRFINHKGEVRL